MRSNGPALLLPPVIGHRGAAALAPENTLAGIRLAAKGGVRWVENDVRLSADGVPVLSHDATLERMAGIDRAVSSLTAAELGRIAVPGPFSGNFASETVPTLEAALALGRALRIGVNVELKAARVRNRALVHAVARTLDDARGAGGPTVMVSSFRFALLREMRRIAPAQPIGYLMGVPKPGWQQRAREIDAAVLICSAQRSTPADIAALTQFGRPVACYTVNDVAIARRVFSRGAMSVFSDDPARMLVGLKTKR